MYICCTNTASRASKRLLTITAASVRRPKSSYNNHVHSRTLAVVVRSKPTARPSCLVGTRAAVHCSCFSCALTAVSGIQLVLIRLTLHDELTEWRGTRGYEITGVALVAERPFPRPYLGEDLPRRPVSVRVCRPCVAAPATHPTTLTDIAYHVAGVGRTF